MSGFWVWVAGPQGTLALTAGALTFGVIAGWLAARAPRPVSRRVRRELADRAAARAAGQFRALRDPEWAQRREAMARRTHPVFRQPPELHHEAVGLVSRFLDPQVAHEAWLAHSEQAVDLANDDPTGRPDVLAQIHADLDGFLASIRAEAGQ